MAFVNMTGSTELDNSLILAFDQGFIVAAGQDEILEQFASYKADIGAKSIQMPKYSRLTVSTTPLGQYSEAGATQMADAPIILTPQEYGKVVTTTSLLSLQSGGKADLAAASVVGTNMGMTMDALALQALNLSANKTVAAITGATLDASYTKLAAKSIQMINGAYVALVNAAGEAQLRNESGFIEVAKYGVAETVLKNEIGFYKGHKIVRHNGVAAGTVFSLGFNAFGKAVSHNPELRLTGPFDDLGRFVNVGWYGVVAYSLIDTDAVEVIVVA